MAREKRLVDGAAAGQAGHRLGGQHLFQQRFSFLFAHHLEVAGQPLEGGAGQVGVLGGDDAGEIGMGQIGPGFRVLRGCQLLGVDGDAGGAGGGGENNVARMMRPVAVL